MKRTNMLKLQKMVGSVICTLVVVAIIAMGSIIIYAAYDLMKTLIGL